MVFLGTALQHYFSTLNLFCHTSFSSVLTDCSRMKLLHQFKFIHIAFKHSFSIFKLRMNGFNEILVDNRSLIFLSTQCKSTMESLLLPFMTYFEIFLHFALPINYLRPKQLKIFELPSHWVLHQETDLCFLSLLIGCQNLLEDSRLIGNDEISKICSRITFACNLASPAILQLFLISNVRNPHLPFRI